MGDTPADTFTIAHLSDLHCGGQYFVPGLLERAIAEINDLQPDIVVCSGDLTTFGFKHEYQEAKRYLDRIQCRSLVVIPGNHDSRNVGYVHFEDMFGQRNSVLRKDGSSETLSSPNTVKLRVGDSIIENEGLVHYGANDGKKLVVIDVAALLHTDEPLATPVGTGATGGDDVVYGNAGNDLLHGGPGRDVLMGGAGRVAKEWTRLGPQFLRLGPVGWHEFFRDSRVVERVLSRLRAGLAWG